MDRMQRSELANLVEQYISNNAKGGKGVAFPIPGLMVVRHSHPTTLEATLYEPLFVERLQNRGKLPKVIIADVIRKLIFS